MRLVQVLLINKVLPLFSDCTLQAAYRAFVHVQTLLLNMAENVSILEVVYLG